jgi:hypothetical protein
MALWAKVLSHADPHHHATLNDFIAEGGGLWTLARIVRR